MGGSGSGSTYHWWRSGKKTTVEDGLNIDANRWTREGILLLGQQRLGSWEWHYRNGKTASIEYEVDMRELAHTSVRLRYCHTNAATKQAQSLDYRVLLTPTRPRFGGFRWWFLCPLLVRGWPCNRRSGKLYLPPGGRYFGCRRCYDLTYTSCQESHKDDRLYRFMASSLGVDFESAKGVMRGIGRR